METGKDQDRRKAGKNLAIRSESVIIINRGAHGIRCRRLLDMTTQNVVRHDVERKENIS